MELNSGRKVVLIAVRTDGLTFLKLSNSVKKHVSCPRLYSYLYEWDVQQTAALPLGLGSVHVETHRTEPPQTNTQHCVVRHSQDGIQKDLMHQSNSLS